MPPLNLLTYAILPLLNIVTFSEKKCAGKTWTPFHIADNLLFSVKLFVCLFCGIVIRSAHLCLAFNFLITYIFEYTQC